MIGASDPNPASGFIAPPFDPAIAVSLLAPSGVRGILQNLEREARYRQIQSRVADAVHERAAQQYRLHGHANFILKISQDEYDWLADRSSSATRPLPVRAILLYARIEIRVRVSGSGGKSDA